jgi:hypothetical protein
MRKLLNGTLVGAGGALAVFAVWAFSPWATTGALDVGTRGALVLAPLLAAGSGYVARTPSFPRRVGVLPAGFGSGAGGSGRLVAGRR